MAGIIETAKKLFTNGEVRIIIGYGAGSRGNVRPFFVQTEEDIQKLIFDERCTQNLAMYIYKKDIAKLGKPAIIANIQTLRGIIRLATEKQIEDDSLIALCINDKNEITECRTFSEMEEYISAAAPKIKDEDKKLIEELATLTPAERWAFWQNEMENCIKCYACRQSCPLCYCSQCTVEINQPQWIPVAASTLGNLEWHIMRAMHLSGRCITCGQCAEACPVNIPIHLLPIRLAEEIQLQYGSVSGMNRNEGCAMSTYKPDDKENFIG